MLSAGKDPFSGFVIEDLGDLLDVLGIEDYDLDYIWDEADKNADGTLDLSETDHMWNEILKLIHETSEYSL